MLKKTKKHLLFILGWVSLVTGFIGIFLPILPTTPFVILSAYCFSKSSDKVHKWLLDLKLFGPMIRQWEKNKSIPIKAKLMATSMIIPLFAYTLIFVPVVFVIKFIVFSIGAFALGYIWTRPSK